MSEKGLSTMAVKRCFAVSVVIVLRGQYDDRILSEEAWGRGALIGAMGPTIGCSPVSCLNPGFTLRP